jgi:hypothetical protein
VTTLLGVFRVGLSGFSGDAAGAVAGRPDRTKKAVVSRPEVRYIANQSGTVPSERRRIDRRARR